jgi:glyoxalase family protein
MDGVHGIHHITAISGPAQENLDFYSGVLGMRLVKKSVNQDDPGTYHLFYADAAGNPGTDLTFFPWAQMAPPRMGHGLAVEVALEISGESLDYWGVRLLGYGAKVETIETRFKESDSVCRPARVAACPRRACGPRRAAFEPWIAAPFRPRIRYVDSSARCGSATSLAPQTS